jgi:aerobic carbon-monoxide dehydrogenase medium subunit
VRRFKYFEPATLGEAVALLAHYHGQAQALAGGTDLLVEIKEQARRADCVVNIKKIPGIAGLSYDARAGLRIGALVTAREIELSSFVLQNYASLAQAARELGSIQVRNRATIVGNVCRASPSADTLPPLIADGATVRIAGLGAERVLPLEEFFTGPGKTVLRSEELVTEIMVPPPPPHTGKVYIKHGRRKAMELATVGVAVSLTLDSDVKIVLGAVAPTPIRARQAEALLRGGKLNPELIEKAAKAAVDESRPISNVRASAAYRRDMVGVLTRRALEQAYKAAQ